MKRVALVLFSAVLVTCGPDLVDDDGGVIEPDDDAGTVDAGAPDAGEDAGAVDAGEDDAGAMDAGVIDSGVPDAGEIITCTAGGIPGTCMDIAECYGTRTHTAGLCPGPSNIQCCTPRYANACDPNVVPEPNAGLTSLPSDGGCALPGMLRVDTFCVDQFEASVLEVLDGGATQPWSPYFNPAGHTLRAQSVPGAVPQGYINQTQASAACANAGKRLCTDTEWLRACRGPSNFTYPYGNTRQAGVCNDARGTHPAVELYGTSASWIYSHIDSPCLNQLQPGLDLTGANAGCVTSEGLLDMMGNLHEWTADPAGTFRGGYYVDTQINGNGCLYATTAHDTSYWDYSTGFRCCATPQ